MPVETENEKLFCDFCDEPITEPRLAYALVDSQYGDPGAHYVHSSYCSFLFKAKHRNLKYQEKSLDKFLTFRKEREKEVRAVLIKKGWVKVSPKSPELKTLATEAENGPVRRKTPPPI